MKVLITGGCGFLGSHVCELFHNKGWDVVAYDNLTKFELLRTGYNVEGARDYNTEFLSALDVEVVIGDIRDDDHLLEVSKGCNYIVNCAAQPAMTIALERPSFDCDNNVVGTLNVLEVARRLNIPMAMCSTIHVYGNGINSQLAEYEDRFYTRQAVREDRRTLTGLITPLHVSKYAGELYARAFIETYDCKVAVFRLTGIYGPRQLGGEDHGWVANFAIRTILGLSIKIFGTDKQVRDILYVKDAAQSFYDWFENGQVSGVYNIGGGEPCITSIRQCLRMLTEITNNEQNIILEPERKGDLWYFCCNINKAHYTFGWQPKVLPKEGITELVKWIQENKELFQGGS